MPVFKYEALDAQGVAIKDEIEALSQKEAVSKIRNMGYFPTKVNARGAAKKPAAKAAARPKKRRGAGGKVKVKYITQFARQLSTLQDAGLPILRSLRILQEQQKCVLSLLPNTYNLKHLLLKDDQMALCNPVTVHIQRIICHVLNSCQLSSYCPIKIIKTLHWDKLLHFLSKNA